MSQNICYPASTRLRYYRLETRLENEPLVCTRIRRSLLFTSNTVKNFDIKQFLGWRVTLIFENWQKNIYLKLKHTSEQDQSCYSIPVP